MKLSKIISLFAVAGMLAFGASQVKAQGNVDDYDFVLKVELSGTFLTQNPNDLSGDTLKFSYTKTSFNTKDLLALVADCYGNEDIADSGNYVALLDGELWVVAKNGDLVENIDEIAGTVLGEEVMKGSQVVSGSKVGKFSTSFVGSGILWVECVDGENTYLDFFVGGGVVGDSSGTAFNNEGESTIKQSLTGKNLVGFGVVDNDEGIFDGVTLKIKGKGVILD